MPALWSSKKTVQRWWLWAVTGAIVLPTLTLLVVQYRSLRMLEQTLPVYRRELMYRFLDSVSSEVFFTYRDHANRVLSVPAEAITLHENGVIQTDGERTRVLQAVARVADYFGQQEFKGAQRFFLVVATRENGHDGDEVLFYNPASRALEFDPQAAELRAIRVACAAFMFYIRAGTDTVQRGPIGIDRDVNYTMMVKFIRDAKGRPLAMAGFVLDLTWFRNEVVPNGIRKQLPLFLPGEEQNAVIVLRVDDNTVLYSNQPAEGVAPEVTLRLNPYFMRLGLGVSVRGLNASGWARRSLILNVILSLTMTLVLAGALLLGWRAATREMKLSRMKTDFVANISHEFRTPLSSILALAELMKMGRVKDFAEVREFGHYIESQGHRVMRMVSNILDFARIESGQKEYYFEPVDARKVVNAALEACAGQLKKSGRTINLEAPPALPPGRLDAAAMTLALTNLLDNAIKYSGAKEDILIRLGHDNDELLITVTDQGIGIARDEQERVFEKFYRVSAGLVHDVKGSGLGLAIVKHIVEAHRGRVTVESELGRGSSFTIHLPIE
jgi:signal transduction histidine kinase